MTMTPRSLSRRSACTRLAAALTGACLLAAGAAAAQDASKFPERPISIIVPFSAGGGTDLGARLVAADLEKELGQSVVVVNREGAGSQTGLTALANAKPDGYTIGAVNMPAMNTIILSPERKAAFGIDSFDFLINHVVEPIIIAVRPDSPYKTLKDLMDDAKRRPGELRVGTSGALTPEHLAQLQLEQAAPTKLRIAHFDGAAGSMTQFRGGRTDVAFTTPSFLQDVRPLAVLTKERLKNLPDIPTAVEQGYPTMVMTSSRGFAVPKGVPAPVLAKLRDAFARVANSEAHKQRAAEKKLTVQVMSGSEYTKYVHDLHQEAGKLVQLAKDRQ
jgi:tripartite-type tricarboxylate transporter receptor subunit TctC